MPLIFDEMFSCAAKSENDPWNILAVKLLDLIYKSVDIINENGYRLDKIILVCTASIKKFDKILNELVLQEQGITEIQIFPKNNKECFRI